MEKCACGHTRAAHTSTKCSVCICSCRGFTVPADSPPQTLVVEQDSLTVPKLIYVDSTTGEPCPTDPSRGILCTKVYEDQAHRHMDSRAFEQVRDHTAGFSNTSGLLACSACGAPYSSIDSADPAYPGEDDSDNPPEPGTQPLTGYLVVYAGELKVGDIVQVYGVEGGFLRAPAQPIEPPGPTALQKRIADAIDKGWEDYEFNADLAVDAVQDLFCELLREGR